jgi:hypothetical protein
MRLDHFDHIFDQRVECLENETIVGLILKPRLPVGAD